MIKLKGRIGSIIVGGALAGFLLAGGGCQRLQVEPSEVGLWVADFERGITPAVFSDADEVASSVTTFHLDSVDGMSGAAVRATYDIESYGGMAMGMEPHDVLQFGAIVFSIRLVSGELPDMRIQLRSTEDHRKRVTINPYIAASEHGWQRVRIPLSKFGPYGLDGLRHVNQVAFILRKGKGVIEFDDVYFEKGIAGEMMSKVKYPERTDKPLPAGYGAWCYGNAQFTIDHIKTYNATAPEGRRIKYLFPWAGSIYMSRDGQPRLSWEPDRARSLAEALGPDVLVMPMVDGLSRGMDRWDHEQWDKLARNLAKRYEAEPLFYGMHLDIEPHDDFLYNLFGKIKDYTRMPLTAALGSWSVDSFRYTDMVVYMAYDWDLDPARFGELAQERFGRFLRDAVAGGGKAMIGVPAIATHREYEGIKQSDDAPLESTGHEMVDYVKGSLAAIRTHTASNGAAYVGLSIWALHEQDGLHGPHDTQWFYPTRISEETWDVFRGVGHGE